VLGYASRTGTRRNVAALRSAGWRFLITPQGQTSASELPFALDNGAWHAFQNGLPWDAPAFVKLLERRGREADWVVAPDVVAGGLESLALSVSWLPRIHAVCPLALIAVQDGMEPADLAPLVGPGVGIFLGGSTEWKLARMIDWGIFAASMGVHYHVARVNTLRRIRLAAVAGADSIDGSSASRFAVTLPPLDAGIRQGDMFAPQKRETPRPGLR